MPCSSIPRSASGFRASGRRSASTSLSGRGREIAILIAAGARRSDYEWNAHERIGHTAGLTEAETDAIFHGRDAASFSRDEQMIATVVRELAAGGSLDDELFAQAEEVLGTTQVADLVILVGYYSMLASLLAVWRVPLKPDYTPRFSG
jgi:alkylhydroperoxidase family enzyme